MIKQCKNKDFTADSSIKHIYYVSGFTYINRDKEPFWNCKRRDHLY